MIKIFELWIKGDVFFFVDNLTVEQKDLLVSFSKEYFSNNIISGKENLEKFIRYFYTSCKITLEQVEISDVITIK